MSEASGLSYTVGSTIDGQPVLSAKLLPNRLKVWRGQEVETEYTDTGRFSG